MYRHYLFLTAFLASLITAVPLNINLGAYSPALVVGDGEISFGGKQDVANLMNALQGAAINGAAANGAPAPAPAPAATVVSQAPEATTTPGGITEASVADPNLQIAALQGIASERKEIEPRIRTTAGTVEKRDLAGFDRALKYAADALKTGPKIQLGTGAEGSGVGIIQEAGINAPAAAAPAAKKRALETPQLKTTVTTMFIRGGPLPAVKARSIEESAVDKRAPSEGIDAVNLNMAQGQVAELTFVETRAAGENDD